jgi:uncharacterized repeat protein (TIGR01451 family)
MRVKHFILLSLASLLMAGAFSGVAKATSHPRVPAFATANDKLKFTTVNKNLSTSGATNVTIVSVSVPAGSWVLSAEGDFVNFGPSDYARCQLFAGVNPTPGGGITTTVGDPNLPGAQGPAAYVQAFAEIAAVTSATGFTASLQCSHDHDTPPPNGPPYVDAGATLWAHRSS